MATLTRKRRNPAKSRQFQQESLSRATSNLSLANYPAIYEGFLAMGIPESDILPRCNIFTFNAWKALGRYVRKGEHGVKVNTWIEGTREKKDGKKEAYKFCRTTTVFHVSQTSAIDESPAPAAIAGYLEYHPQTSWGRIMVTVKTIRAGIEYRANVNGKSLRLVYDQEAAVVWINTNTAHLGGFLIARFGGALSPLSIREFFRTNEPCT